MKVYAETPVRCVAQVVGDVLAVVWAFLAVKLALAVHAQVERLGAPGRGLEDAGTGLRDKVAAASDKVADLPVVGDALRSPFDAIAATGGSIAAAGRAQQEAVSDVAVLLAVLVAVVALLVVVVWLCVRIRWMVRASRASRMAHTEAGSSLLALRALTNRPVRRLTPVAADPADAWRRADPEAVRRLAAVELRALGLRAGR